MTLKYSREIEANISRAETSINAAKDLISSGYFDFASSRAYYAVFYAATAVLLSEDLQYGKHSGVISAIHKNFVKTGRLGFVEPLISASRQLDTGYWKDN